MKLAGVIFIVASAGSVGLQLASALRDRCRLLRQLLAVLQILKNEIAVCATPLPQAFALMAASATGAVERLWSAMARELDRQRWLTVPAAMDRALAAEKELTGEPELCQALWELATGLGKYDRQIQLQSIGLAVLRLEELLAGAERERSVRSGTYRLLGVCAGASIAILLL